MTNTPTIETRLAAALGSDLEQAPDVTRLTELVERAEDRNRRQLRLIGATTVAAVALSGLVLYSQRGTAPQSIAPPDDIPFRPDLGVETHSFAEVVPTLLGDVWLRVAIALAVLAAGWKLASMWRRRRVARPLGRVRAGLLAGVLGTLAVVMGIAMSLDTFFVASNSMLPTLTPGSRTIVAAHDRAPQVGEVIVVNIDTEFGDGTVVRRVVAVGGDNIQARDGQLLLNGSVADTITLDRRRELDDFGPVVVPENSIFVMGDNYAASFDSRRHGPLPVDNIRGTVRWSTGGSALGPLSP